MATRACLSRSGMRQMRSNLGMNGEFIHSQCFALLLSAGDTHNGIKFIDFYIH